MSETMLTGAILAMVGGLLDTYTYLCRGGVFANAQTGNIVLLGIKTAQGDFWGTIHYIAPILCFIVGILLSDAIGGRFKSHTKAHWRQIIILLEILVLTAVAFIPGYNTAANCLVSFTCALQVQSFRKINGKAYASTMCTGNLRSATEQLYAYKKTKDRTLLKHSLQYYAICVFFVLGAALGVLLIQLFSQYAVLFACLLLAAVFLLMFIKNEG